MTVDLQISLSNSAGLPKNFTRASFINIINLGPWSRSSFHRNRWNLRPTVFFSDWETSFFHASSPRVMNMDHRSYFIFNLRHQLVMVLPNSVGPWNIFLRACSSNGIHIDCWSHPNSLLRRKYLGIVLFFGDLKIQYSRACLLSETFSSHIYAI